MTVLGAYPWIADRFADVREESGGRYVTAGCPLKAHRHAAVRFWLAPDTGALCFGCYANCNKLEILRAVGAGWRDCFPAGADLAAVRPEVTARYSYRDEAGVLLYQTLRLEPGRGGRDKEFRQRRPDPAAPGRWVWNLDGVRRVLYRLPDVLAAAPHRTVFVVAGEKDADSLAAVGVLATTNVGGERAGWRPEYSAALAGRPVVVVEDRDSAGRRHADEVVGSVTDAGAASVRRVRLPEKDATAFLNGLRRAGVGGPAALRAALAAAVGVARRWEPVGST